MSYILFFAFVESPEKPKTSEARIFKEREKNTNTLVRAGQLLRWWV